MITNYIVYLANLPQNKKIDIILINFIFFVVFILIILSIYYFKNKFSKN